MTRRAAVRAVDIDLLIDRAEARGLTIEAVEITVDGSIRILTHRPKGAVALNDDQDWVSLAGEKAHIGRA